MYAGSVSSTWIPRSGWLVFLLTADLQGMKYLVQEHGLDTQPGKKTPVYIEDIGPFNETILSTQEKKFYLGFQRIQVCLFNSLALFTVHRRNALLSLQFKDLQISLQKDPRGGPPVPMIELTPEGTKKFLGLTKLYVETISLPLSTPQSPPGP